MKCLFEKTVRWFGFYFEANPPWDHAIVLYIKMGYDRCDVI